MQEQVSRNHPEKFLTLTIDKEYFALDIYAVREILDLSDITRIPHMPDYMLGVVNVRGAAVPVIDLGLKFKLGPVKRSINTRIVILEIKRGEDVAVVGAMADSVKEVVEIGQEAIDPPPQMGASVNTAFLSGIGKHRGKFILLLDESRIFSSQEIETLEEQRGIMNSDSTDAAPQAFEEAEAS